VATKEKKTPTLRQLWNWIEGLKERLTRTERDVSSLKDILNVHNNWAAATRTWSGRDVRFACGPTWLGEGTLLWIDRYNIGIAVADNDGKARERLYNKGSITWIALKE